MFSSSSSFEDYAPEVLRKLQKRARDDLERHRPVEVSQKDWVAFMKSPTIEVMKERARNVAMNVARVLEEKLLEDGEALFNDLDFNPDYEAAVDEEEDYGDDEVVTDEEPLRAPALDIYTVGEKGDRTLPDGTSLIPWEPAMGHQPAYYGCLITNLKRHKAYDFVPVSQLADDLYVMEENKFFELDRLNKEDNDLKKSQLREQISTLRNQLSDAENELKKMYSFCFSAKRVSIMSSSCEEYTPEVLSKLQKRGREDLDIFVSSFLCADPDLGALVEAPTLSSMRECASRILKKHPRIPKEKLLGLVNDVFSDLTWKPKYESEECEDDDYSESDVVTDECQDPALPDLTVWVEGTPEEENLSAPLATVNSLRRPITCIILSDGTKLIPWTPEMGACRAYYGVQGVNFIFPGTIIRSGTRFVPIDKTPDGLYVLKPNAFYDPVVVQKKLFETKKRKKDLERKIQDLQHKLREAEDELKAL